MSSTVFFADANSNELATLTNTWTVTGTPTDPSAVSLVVTDPQGTAATYTFGGSGTIVKVSAGKYTLDVPCLLNGLYSYVWIGTGAASDVVTGTWTVQESTPRNFYTSVEEVKSSLGITDTADDFEIQRAVEDAAAWIEQFTGRYFWNGTGTRTYRNHSIYDMEIDDLISVTQLATDADGDGVYETVWNTTQYQLEVTEHEYNQRAKGEWWPYTKLQALGVPGGNYLPYVWAWSNQNRVQIQGQFGWLEVPRMVRRASLLLAVDYFKMKDAPFGVAGFGDYGPMRVMENPTVAGMLRRYIRSRVKVGV